MVFLSRLVDSVTVFLCVGVYNAKGDCGAIPVFEHSRSNLTAAPPYPQETVAEISCNPGYARSGYRIIKCRADGTWWQHESPPTCTAKSCGDPGTPQNGRKDTYLYTVGSTVRFSCIEGYEIQGNENRICKVTAEWTGSTPTCSVVSCPALLTPANGALQGSELTYQSTVSLFCNDGFRSVGPTSRVCQGDKTWSNQEFVCQEIDCGPFGSVANANIEQQGGTTWGASVTVTCFNNATSSISQINRIIHCNDEGVWAPEPHQCLGCCDLSEKRGDNSVPYISNRDCVDHGTIIRSSLFSCNAGFSQQVIRLRECTNGSMLPVIPCLPIQCEIKRVKNGRTLEGRQGDIVEFDTTITVNCSQGYSVSGRNPTRCTKSVIYPSCSPAGCAIPTDFNGTIQRVDRKLIQLNPKTNDLIPHDTKLLHTCPENFVMPPAMNSFIQLSCEYGELTALKTCIEAPCPVTIISEFNSMNFNPSCLLEGGKHVKHGCSFSTTCIEGHKANGTCVYGLVKSSCKAPKEVFPPWKWVVICLAIVSAIGAGIGSYCFLSKKKVSKCEKPETITLKGCSYDKANAL